MSIILTFLMNHELCPATGSVICRCADESESEQVQKNNILLPDLRIMLRKLFTDHAVYTKFYIESALNDLPDSTQLANRLFENQEEIGLNVGYIVGEKNGQTLTTLLKAHIAAAANAVSAAKKKEDLTVPKQKLFANSAQVAKFISSLDESSLPYDEVKKQFDQHNTYVLEIVTLQLEKKYDDEIKTYDMYYNHMMMFSDMLFVALNKALLKQTRGNSNIFGQIIFLLIIIVIIYLVYKMYNQLAS